MIIYTLISQITCT